MPMEFRKLPPLHNAQQSYRSYRERGVYDAAIEIAFLAIFSATLCFPGGDAHCSLL